MVSPNSLLATVSETTLVLSSTNTVEPFYEGHQLAALYREVSLILLLGLQTVSSLEKCPLVRVSSQRSPTVCSAEATTHLRVSPVHRRGGKIFLFIGHCNLVFVPPQNETCGGLCPLCPHGSTAYAVVSPQATNMHTGPGLVGRPVTSHGWTDSIMGSPSLPTWYIARDDEGHTCISGYRPLVITLSTLITRRCGWGCVPTGSDRVCVGVGGRQ